MIKHSLLKTLLRVSVFRKGRPLTEGKILINHLLAKGLLKAHQWENKLFCVVARKRYKHCFSKEHSRWQGSMTKDGPCHRDMEVKKYNEIPWHTDCSGWDPKSWWHWQEKNSPDAEGKHHGTATLLARHSLAMRPSTHTPGCLPSWFQSSCVHSDLLVKLYHYHACICQNQTATKVPSARSKVR